MISYSFYYNDDRIRRHVSNLVESGYDVDMISLRYKKGNENQDTEHVRFFYPMERSYGQSQIKMIMAYIIFCMRCSWIMLRAHLFQHRLSLVHVNNMPNFLVFSALPLRLFGTRVLLDVHDAVPENYQEKFHGPLLKILTPLLFWEERLSMWFSDYVICTEHTKFGRLLQNGLKKRKGAVVMNAADPAMWDRKTVGISQKRDSSYRMVYHGTLARRLGLDIAILAVKELVPVIPDIRFDIIGDGDQRTELIQMTADLGLQDHVFFSDGFVSVTELPALLKDADVAIVPAKDSIAFKYNLSCKLLDYVVFDIPCIASDVPTHTYYFSNDQMRFFSAGDIESLKYHIQYLYEHPEERVRLVQKAREFLELHDYNSECNIYKNVVRCLVDRKWDELRAISDSCKI
ncbi:glycosyltransferase [bacterium]|nr:glycosyltransferase [bacterium]